MDFNPKYHAVIKGWDALNRYCERRWKERPEMIEHFGHLPEVDIQMVEVKAPGDWNYTQYFILSLRDEQGWHRWADSDEVRKGIENGTIKPMKV